MPLILDDLQNMPVVHTYDPKKFFNSKLTGRGGKSAGRLSAKNNPVTIDPNLATSSVNYRIRKKEYKNKFTTTTQIPLNPIFPDYYESVMNTLPMPELNDMVLIGNHPKTKRDIYIHMAANTIVLEETSAPANMLVGNQTVQTGSSIKVNYQIFFFMIGDPTNRTAKMISQFPSNIANTENLYTTFFSDNPMSDCGTHIYQYITNLGYNVNPATITDYITNFDLYTSVVKMSEIWQTNLHTIMDSFFENAAGCIHKTNNSNSQHALQYVYDQVRYIMSYNVPLDLYKNIYQSVTKHFTPDEAKNICKQNLNLMLSDTMNNLNNNKNLIPSFTIPQNLTEPQSVQKLSPEQHTAVTSTEPLILVQAGAGTGKSTLILGRIDYLTACGIKPEDITVLSFTNAAADHIKDKNPNVHSMTIASMIHEIYSANHTDHALSSMETLYNSIDIYYPKTPQSQLTNSVPHDFQKLIGDIIFKKPDQSSAVTAMSNFIEEHYDEVIQVLDKIKQTTLELEIIICYHKIGTFKEPATVQSKFLIIDEVQDNSIFEFIYMLRYIEKHKESLFIVGDCSQTLYEFRASNPRALNILENSNTFAAYQLNVNYRSNQEILDFANIALLGIEANQYARIQLQANSMAKVTEQSFLDKVFFNYQRLSKKNEFHDTLESVMPIEIKPYLDMCLAKGEQVAFLSYPRKDLDKIREILEKMYPNKQTVSLIPTKTGNTTLLSDYIKKYWDELKWAPTQDMISLIVNEINSRLDYLVNRRIKDPQKFAQSILSKWITEAAPAVSMWSNMVTNGQLSHDAFMNNVKENMLQFEIRYNAIKQSLTSARNRDEKNSDASKTANFLLSTVHSAKGLEFDNVVVLYNNTNAMKEEDKRLYYVAFTRAMKSEYILAYGTMASPQIQADYLTVLKKLHDVAPSANSPLNIPSKDMKIKI